MSAAISMPESDFRSEDERIAEAIALVRVSLVLHERAGRDLDTAVDALAVALDRVVDAREAYTRVGGVVLDASMLLARTRDGAGR